MYAITHNKPKHAMYCKIRCASIHRQQALHYLRSIDRILYFRPQEVAFNGKFFYITIAVYLILSASFNFLVSTAKRNNNNNKNPVRYTCFALCKFRSHMPWHSQKYNKLPSSASSMVKGSMNMITEVWNIDVILTPFYFLSNLWTWIWMRCNTFVSFETDSHKNDLFIFLWRKKYWNYAQIQLFSSFLMEKFSKAKAQLLSRKYCLANFCKAKLSGRPVTNGTFNMAFWLVTFW